MSFTSTISPAFIQFWHKKQGDITAIGSIIFFFFAFFGWAIFSGNHVIAGDSLFYTYPLRTIAWRMIMSGELPLWTPHVFSGYPLLSMAQIGLGYPLTWGYLVFPGYVAEKIVILAPFLLAPLFTYLYLRSINRSVLGSLLGALTFGYGGLMASRLSNNGLLTNSVMWLPLFLIVLERSRRYRFVPSLVAATCIYCSSVLTGLPQGFIIVGLIAGAYSICLCVFPPMPKASSFQYGMNRWRPFIVTVSAALLSIGVAAFQILESARVVPLSVRSSLTYESFTQGSYDIPQLWQSFLTPIFYALDTHAYVPPLAVALSVLAVLIHLRAADLERDTRVFFWAAVAAIAVILMLGIHTPLYWILYNIPVLNLFRVPSRHTIEWTFAVAVLSAYGWDTLTRLLKTRLDISRRNVASTYASIGLTLLGLFIAYQWWKRGQWLGKGTSCLAEVTTSYQLWKVAFVSVLLAAMWQAALVRSHLLRAWLVGAAICITCFVEPSLLVHRWWSDFAMPKSRFTQPSEITQFLKQFPTTENRLYTRTILMADQDTKPRFDAPNLSGMWGLHEVAGYEPLILQRYSRALGGAWLDGVHPANGSGPDPTLVSDRSHVLDLLNTRFMVTFANLATANPDPSDPSTPSATVVVKPSDSWKKVFENRGAIVWRNSGALPRAWLVVDARAVDADTSLRTIRGEIDESFDPTQTALLEVSQSELPRLPGGTLPPNSSVKITEYESNRLTLQTDAPTNTVLVVSEIFYPGWQVNVDGKQARIITANYLLRGVALPPGQHTVEMHYAAPAARIGAIISLLTFALLVSLAVYSRRVWFAVAENSSNKVPRHSFITSENKLLRWLHSNISLSRWVHPVEEGQESSAEDLEFSRAILNVKGSWWSIAFIVLFFLTFFGRIFINNRFVITGDAFFYSYPLRTAAWEMIRHGHLPLWTPLYLSGYPLLAVAQLGLGYPLTWFHLIFPGHIAEQIYVLAPFLITPITTYAYLRQVHRSHLASIFGALVFAYGGMMCGILANSGMLTNGFSWAPLMLIFVDRARTQSFAYCLFWTTLSYGLAVLAGHAQSYVYVGMLGLAYATFISVSIGVTRKQGWTSFSTWRPLLVTIGAMALAAGLAAFQILEVMRAAKRSIRSALTYEMFSEGSFAIREALMSLGAPIYHYVDSGTYLTPIAFVTAAIAVIAISKRRITDGRIWFWITVAVVSWLLLLGSSTPLNTLVYRVPVLNTFRVPSRHTFEWTLAVSVLAAYGWDQVELFFRKRGTRTSKQAGHKSIVSIVVIAIAAVIGILFWRAVVQIPEPNPSIYTGLPERAYWQWKAIFTVLVFIAGVFSFQICRDRIRIACLLLVIFLASFFEVNATTNCWWAGLLSLPAERFKVVSTSTRYLQQFPAEQNRIYTRAGLFAEEFTTEPRLEAPNLTMLSHLQNAAGMEPVMLQRYSRAFGDVGPDLVTPRPGIPVKNDLFQSRSHVLDLLNVTHAVTFMGSIGIYEDVTTPHEGVNISVADLNISLKPGEATDFRGSQQFADELVVVSTLSNSAGDPDNAPVARVRFISHDGHIAEREILTGVHTAEWAHDRPDIRTTIRHRLATVFDSRPGDEQNTFPSYRYWGRIKIDPPFQVDRIQVINISKTATITISKLSLVNSHDSQSSPLWLAPSSAWTTVLTDRGVEVLKNSRALPRAWLVAQAQSTDGETALRAIRGEGAQDFDPHQLVLLEAKPEELPELPGGQIDPSNEVRIVEYQPTKLTIETNAPTNTVLVVSEIFYPGWEATIDGQKTSIKLADYLLRAVVVPPGRHRIQMRYEAPAARYGAAISILTLTILVGLFLWNRRRGQTKQIASNSNETEVIAAPT